MPTFELQTPDGRTFQVEAPDSNTAVKALGQMRLSQSSTTGAVEDYGKAIGSGLVEGAEATAGFLGDMQSLLREVGMWSGEKLRSYAGKEPLTKQQKTEIRSGPSLPTTQDVAEFQRGVTGFEPYEPERTGARYAKGAAEFIPAAAAFGVPGGAKAAVYSAIKYGAIPGLTSEAGGDVAEMAYGEKARPVGKVAGALTGPFVAQAAKRAITPFPAGRIQTDAARVLSREGVNDLTAGQRTGNARLKYREAQVGGAKIDELSESAGRQFTRAALRRAGISADRATPPVIKQGFDDIGQMFDDLSARNTLAPDRQLVTDLGDAVRPYMGNVSPPNRAPVIIDYLTEISNATRGGSIPGTAYKSLRSRIMSSARSTRDADTSMALRAIGSALDDAMERSIGAINPTDLGGFRDARRLYRNMMVIEKAAAGAGEKSAAGIITPARLRFGETSVEGYKARTRGFSEFDELARSGEIAMTPLPNSGTPSRLQAMGFPSTTAAAGGYAGHALSGGDLATALIGGYLGSQAPQMGARIMLSGPGRSYLANQLMANTVVDPRSAAFATMLNATQPARKPLELTVPVSIPSP